MARRRSTQLIVLLATALWLASCTLQAQEPSPPARFVSPLPPPHAVVAVRPRGFVPLVRTAPAAVEDLCSHNRAAATMLHIIRSASWQRRPQMVCHPLLALAADRKARDMARKVYASHTSPSGVSPNDNVRAVGYPLPNWYPVGGNNVESFAAGWGYGAPEIVLVAWAISATHWRHVAATDPFFVGHQCAAVGYARTWGVGFQHYWVFLSAPCPER